MKPGPIIAACVIIAGLLLLPRRVKASELVVTFNRPIDPAKLCDAILKVEGAQFSRNPYQFKEDLWHELCPQVPLDLANGRQMRSAALRHVCNLIALLEEAKIPRTVQNVACCFNAGFDAVLLNKLDAKQRDYGYRVFNCYQDSEASGK